MKLHVFTAFVLLMCLFNLPSADDNSTKVKNQYTTNLLSLKKDAVLLNKLISNKSSISLLRKQFAKTRQSYKKIEVFTEYYNPSTAKAINGAAILEVEPDNPAYPVAPSGFQVIEEIIYEDEVDNDELARQTATLNGAINRLIKVNDATNFTDKHIFDAIKAEIFRVTTLSLSGFDTPISQLAIREIKVVLSEIKVYLSFYNSFDKSENFEELSQIIDEANSYISLNRDFNNFNRAAFITAYLHPIGKKLNAFQEETGIPYFKENRPVNSSAATLFEKDVFNPSFFSSTNQSASNKNVVKLGEALFYESSLSKSGNRNCGSCHNPNKAFTDGLTKNISFDGKKLILRNTPTILYASLQASQFYDSRTAFLEDQAKEVIENPLEMHGNLSKAVNILKNNTRYHRLFEKAYQTTSITADKIQLAIADFIRSKNAFNSKFDRYMNGEKTALNSREIIGFNLFMGKGKCATCHFMPVFNGSVPPGYYKSESEVLGVPKVFKANYILDEDPGKFILYKAKPHLNSFKTPTLRNIAKTAPYMHNGAFNSLDDVMEFYNSGGGAGLGIAVSNQTLPADKLNLTSSEKKLIIAFLNTLTDAEIN